MGDVCSAEAAPPPSITSETTMAERFTHLHRPNPNDSFAKASDGRHGEGHVEPSVGRQSRLVSACLKAL